MAVKISAREEKAANKEAEAVLASLSRAGEVAVTQTLDDIREVLKKDAPLMYHINAWCNCDVILSICVKEM